MSIRSNILICVKKESYKKMQKEREIKPLFDECPPEIFKEINKKVVVFGWDGIKWCPEAYPDEGALMNFLRKNPKEPYKFIEIRYDGEGKEKIEENWVDGSCNHIWISKDLTID